jgi:hypothetical protein
MMHAVSHQLAAVLTDHIYMHCATSYLVVYAAVVPVCVCDACTTQKYGDLSIACDFASCIQLTYIAPMAILVIKWFTGV